MTTESLGDLGINEAHRTTKAQGIETAANVPSQFTPGPWSIGQDYKGIRYIYGHSVDPFTDEPAKLETRICGVEEGAWIYEQGANARLIAAAPELYNACVRLVLAADHSNPLKLIENISEAVEKARKALDKAKGVSGS